MSCITRHRCSSGRQDDLPVVLRARPGSINSAGIDEPLSPAQVADRKTASLKRKGDFARSITDYDMQLRSSEEDSATAVEPYSLPPPREAFDGKPLVEWTVDDACLWLASLGAAECMPAFRQHGIDGAQLCGITSDRLRDIGIKVAPCTVHLQLIAAEHWSARQDHLGHRRSRGWHATRMMDCVTDARSAPASKPHCPGRQRHPTATASCGSLKDRHVLTLPRPCCTSRRRPPMRTTVCCMHACRRLTYVQCRRPPSSPTTGDAVARLRPCSCDQPAQWRCQCNARPAAP